MRRASIGWMLAACGGGTGGAGEECPVGVELGDAEAGCDCAGEEFEQVDDGAVCSCGDDGLVCDTPACRSVELDCS